MGNQERVSTDLIQNILGNNYYYLLVMVEQQSFIVIASQWKVLIALQIPVALCLINQFSGILCQHYVEHYVECFTTHWKI